MRAFHARRDDRDSLDDLIRDGARPGSGGAASAGCLTATPTPGASMLVRLPVPPTGVQLRAAAGPGASPVGARVARFADLVPGDPMGSAPGDGSTLRITPRWTATSQWRLEASSTGPVLLCGIR